MTGYVMITSRVLPLIQDAIDAADNVTLIKVTEGTYEEALIIDEPQ